MKTKRVKVKTVLDNIAKNGLPQTIRQFWRNENGRGLESDASRDEVVSACAIGMAAYNLKVPFTALRTVLPHGYSIERWNDDEGLSFQEIADRYKTEYPSSLDKVITINWD